MPRRLRRWFPPLVSTRRTRRFAWSARQLVAGMEGLEDRRLLAEVDLSFPTIAPLTLVLGSPLHLGLDVAESDGRPVTVTVSVDDPTLVEATVLSGNRSVRLEIANFGDLVFELFEDQAPVPANRVAELVAAGFYDGILFHRVIDGFVLQAGDPTATGGGGSDLGSFDDQFDPDLQHSGSGVLSFAKAGDDTNDSQFFITETDTHGLDFNHSVFGQLTEGEAVREAISSVATNAEDRPISDVVITRATLFDDTENGTILLRPLAGTGSTDVTIVVADDQGNSFSQTITVSLLPDLINAQPYLRPLPRTVDVPAGQVAELMLESIDLEGDTVQYLIGSNSTDIIAGGVDSVSGLVQIQTAASFVGIANVTVGVASVPPGPGEQPFDTQLVQFRFFDDQDQQFVVRAVDDRVAVDRNGDEISRLAVPIRRIEVLGGSGNDTVTIQAIDSVAGEMIPLRFDDFGGVDQITLAAANQTLDLTALPIGSVNGVELLDLTGTGGNQLIASRANVDSLLSSTNDLFIRLDPDDSVSLVAGDGVSPDTPDAGFVLTDWGTTLTDFFVIATSTGDATTLTFTGANWTNPINRFDVNGLGGVSALDALIIINQLNAKSFVVSGTESDLVDPATLAEFPMLFFDVTGDGRVSALDALRVINALNARDAVGGEPIVTSPRNAVLATWDWIGQDDDERKTLTKLDGCD